MQDFNPLRIGEHPRLVFRKPGEEAMTPGSHTISGRGFQYNAPVIYIPDAGREIRGLGHVTRYDPSPDGSAIVSIDLNDHYGRGRLVPVDKPVVGETDEPEARYHGERGRLPCGVHYPDE